MSLNLAEFAYQFFGYEYAEEEPEKEKARQEADYAKTAKLYQTILLGAIPG